MLRRDGIMRMRLWLVALGTLPVLAVGSGAIAGTASPPHNGLIASQRPDGIYLIDAQRAKDWKLRGSDDLGAAGPKWSPDGKWIAFVGSDGHIQLISPNGDSLRTVADSGANLAWSPDGSRLAFDTTDAKQSFKQVVVVLDITTGKRTTLL